MESKLKIAIFTIATLVVTVCAVLLIANYNYQNNSQQNGTTPTVVAETAHLEIFDKSGKSLHKYDLHFTSGDSLTDALQKLTTTDSSFTYQATSNQNGSVINTINGVSADSASEFWNIKVNGIDSDLGIDSLKLRDGDNIQLMLANL